MQHTIPVHGGHVQIGPRATRKQRVRMSVNGVMVWLDYEQLGELIVALQIALEKIDEDLQQTP
jgi:hypothetical protein